MKALTMQLTKRARQPVVGLTVLATLIAQAYAQEAPAEPALAGDQVQAIVVTGYRAALQTSARDKQRGPVSKTPSSRKISENSPTAISQNR
jgi:hypothetical protein